MYTLIYNLYVRCTYSRRIKDNNWDSSPDVQSCDPAPMADECDNSYLRRKRQPCCSVNWCQQKHVLHHSSTLQEQDCYHHQSYYYPYDRSSQQTGKKGCISNTTRISSKGRCHEAGVGRSISSSLHHSRVIL